jgi:hypothetical protein
MAKMEKPMAKGTKVAQVVKPVEGTISDIKFNPDELSFEYLVTYTEADGDVSERWFKHEDVKEVM